MTEPSTSAAATPSPNGPITAPPSWGPLGQLWLSLQKVPADTVALTFAMTVAASLILPYLGAVGLYDCWESHYAEVAREMVQRDDYVHPHWKEHYFFSKPVLLFWLSSVGFKLLDLATGGEVTRPGTNLPELTELAARLPIALIGLLTIFCVYRVTRRFFGIPAAVIAAICLTTTPFWALVSRQHITDMPFVGLATAGICLMIESFFGTDEESESPISRFFIACFVVATLPQLLQICRSTQLLQGAPMVVRYVAFAGCAAVIGFVSWWMLQKGRDSRAHFFYLLCGLSTLAKGLPGILLPGLVFLVYVGCTWEWWRLKRIRALTGALIFLLVASPWYVVLTLFTGKDDEGKTFLQRFWIHDHLNRITGGVHGERGTFEYYIKQLGIGVMPWTGLMPFAWLKMANPDKDDAPDETQRKVRLFMAIWALTCFGLFSISTTKFHHYILPMVPPLAICVGIYLGDLWEKRRTAPLVVVMGTVLGTVILSQDLVKNPYLVVDLFTYHYVSYKPDYYMPTDWPYGPAFGVVGAIAALLVVMGALLANADVVRETLAKKAEGPIDKVRWLAAEIVEALVWVGEMFSWLFVKFSPEKHRGRPLVVTLCLGAVVSGYFLTGVYFLKLAPHWSQRYLFNTYFSQKQGDEPIIAYLMNWRGESFYSKGSEPQINDGNQLKTRLKQPGREFVLVETSRFKGLESTLGAEFRGKVNIVDRSNQKWFLVRIDD